MMNIAGLIQCFLPARYSRHVQDEGEFSMPPVTSDEDIAQRDAFVERLVNASAGVFDRKGL